MKYRTKRALYIGGKLYKVGEVVELPPEDAKRFGDDLELIKEEEKAQTQDFTKKIKKK